VIEEVPVKGSKPHMRTVKKFKHPDEQLLVPEAAITRGRHKALPPAMRTRILQKGIRTMEGMLAEDAACVEEAKKLFSPGSKKGGSPGSPGAARRSNSGGAGPSGVKPSPPRGSASSASPRSGKKKMKEPEVKEVNPKLKGFPITPPGQAPGKCEDKIYLGMTPSPVKCPGYI
jgi:hypothetical protein